MNFKTPAGEAEFVACYDAALAQWPVPYTAFYLPTRFGSTYIIACGPEDGEPLVLLHAAGTSSTIWIRNIAAFSRTYRTYLVDIAGDPNRSEWTAPLRTRADCAAWLTEVLDGLKVERTNLGGISLGSWHSLNFALALPNRVKSLMLFAPPAAFAKFRLAFFVHFLGAMLFPSRARVLRTFQWLAAPGKVFDPRQGEQMYLAVKHFRYAFGGIFPQVFADDELRRLQVPTLMLVGAHEVVTDPVRTLARAQRLVPGIRTELVQGAGHVLVMEQPELVNQRALEFLESVSA